MRPLDILLRRWHGSLFAYYYFMALEGVHFSDVCLILF